METKMRDSEQEYASERGDSKKCKATANKLMALVESQSYKCALTLQPLTPENSHLDHKIPLSRGGDNSLGNLQWIHKDVNRAKGEMTNDEFISMCKKVARNTPPMS